LTAQLENAQSESVTKTARDAVVRAEKLIKMYRRGADEIRAVDDVSFTVEQGEFVAVVGPSGAGKTTLLQLVGCMDTPTSGALFLSGKETSRLSDGELTRLRRDHIGFIFQHFGLLPTLTVAENVGISGLFRRHDAKTKARIDQLLERVGLAHRRHHRPSQLSGGEMQRVAIARALVNEPKLLLADEPTGNLDTATSDSIIALIKELSRDGLTVVAVTHNPSLAQAADRCMTLRDGRIL
jgi:putative ABC transport system ATP-binding protein